MRNLAVLVSVAVLLAGCVSAPPSGDEQSVFNWTLHQVRFIEDTSLFWGLEETRVLTTEDFPNEAFELYTYDDYSATLDGLKTFADYESEKLTEEQVAKLKKLYMEYFGSETPPYAE